MDIFIEKSSFIQNHKKIRGNEPWEFLARPFAAARRSVDGGKGVVHVRGVAVVRKRLHRKTGRSIMLKSEARKPTLPEALIVLLVSAVVIGVGVLKYGVSVHIPLVIAATRHRPPRRHP